MQRLSLNSLYLCVRFRWPTWFSDASLSVQSLPAPGRPYKQMCYGSGHLNASAPSSQGCPEGRCDVALLTRGFLSCEASDVATNGGCEQAFDGKDETAWNLPNQTGGADGGSYIGDWIAVKLMQPYSLTTLRFQQRPGSIRIKRIRLRFSDGKTSEVFRVP